MREDEVDSMAELHREEDKRYEAENMVQVAKRLTIVFEEIFADLNKNVGHAARHCRNNDASTALYELASALDAMDMPYLIRDALKVPHPSLKPMKKP